MKKLLAALLLAATAVCAEEVSQTAVYRSAVDALHPDDTARFLAAENTGGTGFYWLDTTNGELWRLDPAVMEWVYLGAPRGAHTGRKGTYSLLPDRNGGVYILNVHHGEGWWTGGGIWKIIGEPSRRKQPSVDPEF
jgi:hypothetical protein